MRRNISPEAAHELNREAALLPSLPSPSVIDRMIGVFSPQRMVNRVGQRYAAHFMDQEYRSLQARSAYKSAEFNRLNQNWNATNQDPNQILKTELKTMRARSRWLFRNNPHAVSAMNGFVNYVVGTGFDIQMRVQKSVVNSATGDIEMVMMEGFNDFVEDMFNAWANDVDIQVSATSPANFVDDQELALRKWIEDGEAFIHMAVDRSHPIVPLRLEFIEPEALDEQIQEYNGNPVVMGVELDKNTWRPLAYWVYSARAQNPQNYLVKNKSVRVPAGRMIHLYRRLRPRQVRGIPFIATVSQRFFDLDQYTDAELIGNKIAACMSVFIAGPKTAGMATPGGLQPTDANGNKIADLEPGLIGSIPEGSSVHVVSPQKPGATFDMFTKYHMKSIAGGMQRGLSYTTMTRDTAGVTFAGGRIAQLQDFQGFRPMQKFFARKFCSPVFREWMDLFVLNGGVTAPGYFNKSPGPAFWQKHGWMPGGWSYGVNPKQEVGAAKDSMNAGITTLEDECSMLGYDWKTQLRKKARVDKEAEKLGVVVNSDAAIGNISRKGLAPEVDPAEAELNNELSGAAA